MPSREHVSGETIFETEMTAAGEGDGGRGLAWRGLTWSVVCSTSLRSIKVEGLRKVVKGGEKKDDNLIFASSG